MVPAAARSPIAVRDLAPETFVLTIEGCGLTNAVRGLFQRNRVRLREYPGQALSYDVVEEWVELGIGAGILPASKVRKLRRSARPILGNSGQPRRSTINSGGTPSVSCRRTFRHSSSIVARSCRRSYAESRGRETDAPSRALPRAQHCAVCRRDYG
jgi:hypothetical protein